MLLEKLKSSHKIKQKGDFYSFKTLGFSFLLYSFFMPAILDLEGEHILK